MRPAIFVPCLCLGFLLLPHTGRAQGAAAVGTRAQGMAGAFVAVADDASAVYWNPGGLAKGALFSLVIEGNRAEGVPDDRLGFGGERGGSLLAFAMPALGLSYSRQAVSDVAPAGLNGFRLSSLVTHHVGATLVQSLTDGIAVGTTLKLVRGRAGSDVVQAGSVEDALDEWDVIGRNGTRVDADLGIMFTGSLGRLGLVVRNASEPSFETPGGGRELTLQRQVRGGGSLFLLQNWILAADVDFTTTDGALGEVREVALGSEAQVHRRLAARAGVRLNTAGERGRTPAASVGGSFALLGSFLVDAQVTAGSDSSYGGWGVAGRLVF